MTPIPFEDDPQLPTRKDAMPATPDPLPWREVHRMLEQMADSLERSADAAREAAQAFRAALIRVSVARPDDPED